MRRNRSTRTARTIENLERRLLMATVNVADFGARVNDGQDDTSAIRAAIEASRDGDTILLAGGTYNISSEIALRPNRTYTGGATIKKSGGYAFTVQNLGENITVDNLVFDGAGITNGSVPARNVTIRNSTFKNINGGGEEKNGIFWGAGAINSRIVNNRFIDIQGHNGVYGFARWDNTEISGNYFENVAEGIHLSYSGENLRVLNNTGKRIKRMAIELQGYNSVNTLVEGNHFTEWHEQRNAASFAYSIMNWGTGTIVRNNYASSGRKGEFDPGRNDAPLGIEFSGNNGIVEGNVIDGFRDGLHVVQADNSIVRNNTFRWQSETAIWITGVASARNTRVENNLTIDAYRGFMSHVGSGVVVENNTFVSTKASRAGRGAVADVSGITYRNNKFQNLQSVFEERAGTFSASGNVAYNSGYATSGFLAERFNDARLVIGEVKYPVSGSTPSTPPPVQTPESQPPVDNTATGNGLLGQYFAGTGLSDLRATRVDAGIDFNWGWGAPAPNVPSSTYSVRWTGQIVPQYSEEYTFYVGSDDGARLWINDQLVVNNWRDQAFAEASGKIRLQAGQRYNLRMEFYDSGGEGRSRLSWSSASQPKQVVPASRLFASTGEIVPDETPSNPAPTQPSQPSSPIGGGNGLTAQYFNRDFSNLLLSRVDPVVDFNWGWGSPHSSVPNERFAARWTGKVQPKYSETYRFHVRADDGVRLWVNGQLIIDYWIDQAAVERTGQIRLEAGKKYDIKLEYYENGGEAVASLAWSSPSQPKQTIPTSALFTA